MSKRQATLGALGFTKKVTDRGKTSKLELAQCDRKPEVCASITAVCV